MLYSLLFILVLAVPASTQEPTRFQAVPDELPTYQVLRTNEGIQVDGRLDEADWQNAAPIAFVMPWSDLEKEQPQSTTARLLWDDDNLYIIYECVDPVSTFRSNRARRSGVPRGRRGNFCHPEYGSPRQLLWL